MLLEQQKTLKKNNKTTVTFSKQSVLFSIDNKIHCIKTKKYDGCDYMTTIVTKIILGYLIIASYNLSSSFKYLPKLLFL